MFYTFLKKLAEIESRIKKLERAYFLLVNDYTSTETERPSAASILQQEKQILEEIEEQAKSYIAAHRELQGFVQEARQQTDVIASEVEALLGLEITFGSSSDEEENTSSNSTLSGSPSPTIFITRNVCVGNQNAETPAVRKPQSRAIRQ
jgi:chromosome segregation ATPase